MRRLALLRGINVAGKNLVPMRELETIFTNSGCRNVSTYIQSGNVIFDATAADRARLSQQLADAIQAHFGLRIPVVLRTRDEVNAVLAHNPFLETGSADVVEDMLHVYFLAAPPEPHRVALLDPARSPPDTFIVSGSEVYLRLPGGMGRTKLTNAYFDAKLGTTCTARNWRTIKKLGELLNARSKR